MAVDRWLQIFHLVFLILFQQLVLLDQKELQEPHLVVLKALPSMVEVKCQLLKKAIDPA